MSRAGARGMSGGNVGNSTVVKTPSASPSASTSTATMHEEDRALLREQLEVKKLEVGLNYMALMQKQTSNELKAEGNRLAADGAARGENPKPSTSFTATSRRARVGSDDDVRGDAHARMGSCDDAIRPVVRAVRTK